MHLRSGKSLDSMDPPQKKYDARKATEASVTLRMLIRQPMVSKPITQQVQATTIYAIGPSAVVESLTWNNPIVITTSFIRQQIGMGIHDIMY